VLSAIRLATKILSRKRLMCWSPLRRAKPLFFDEFQSRANEILHAGDSGTPVAFTKGTCRFRRRHSSQASGGGAKSAMGSRKVTPKEEIMKRQESNTVVTARRAAKFMFGAAAVLTMSMLQTPAHAQALSSFNDPIGEHVVFIGTDGHVHDSFCDESPNCNNGTNWDNQLDLTMRAGGPVAGMYPRLASYADSYGEHIFFTDSTNNVYQLFSANGIGGWSSQSLGVQDVGGMSGYSATPTPPPGIFTTTTDYLFYETSDQHVHLLASSNGSPFADTDLSVASAATSILAAWGTSFTSFHDAGGEHVFYEGTNYHLYEIYSSWQYYRICNPLTRICTMRPFQVWINQDLTNQTHGPLVARIGTSLSDATGESVFYLGQDSHLHEVQNGSTGWVDQDVTISGWAALPYGSFQGPGQIILSTPLGRQLFFIGTDLNVHELFANSSGGADQDVTTLAKAPLVFPCAGAALTGFTNASTPGQSEWVVYYAASDGSVHRLTQTAYEVTYWGLNFWLTRGWTDLNVIPYVFNLHPMNYCIQ
jgi:hypothetical protein